MHESGSAALRSRPPLGLVCILGVRQTVLTSPTEHLPPFSNSRSLFADVKDLCRNRSFLILFGSALYLLVIAGSMNALNLYAYNYFWKLPASLNQLPIFSTRAGLLAGIPLTVLLLKRLEKRDVVLLGVGLIAVSADTLGFDCVWVAWLDAECESNIGTDRRKRDIWRMQLVLFIGFQSVVADAVDEHELKFGQRCDGLYYSALVFSSKSAVGFGSLIAGIVLEVVGSEGKAVNKAAAISDTAESFSGSLWGAGHGLAFLLSVPLILAYRLNRSQHYRSSKRTR
ncbi:MFS transporter [Sphingomonas aerolata]|uniref:MFS transporter n=1 Tax=Sphingomonas aerolata TaxID=185951 RepID=UPI002FE289B4